MTHPAAANDTANILKQPRAVWAVAFACVVAFMGIGLVDPILKPISDELHASPSQVSLLFTSYMAVTGLAMLVTGAISSRIGPKATLLSGLALVVVFSALAGMSDTVGGIIGFRAGWGLGNALFIATALATIVGAASGGVASTIILYEAALGVGIATGPLVGGLLGDVSWRGPFFGVAALMAIAFIAVVALLPRIEKPARATSLADPFRALRNPGLLVMAITALLYNFGFFTLLAYAPFPLAMGAHQIGLIFFGWGVCLAIASVFIAPVVQRRLGTVGGVAVALLAFAVDLAVMGLFVESKAVLVVGVVVAGLFLGINNTLVTEGVMLVSTVERSTASAAYSFVRFGGGAIAPWLAGKLGETISHQVPFWMGATATALGVCVLMGGRRWLGRLAGETPAEHGALEAEAVTIGDA
jgi:predicted MFS family arabinose efflux permease